MLLIHTGTTDRALMVIPAYDEYAQWLMAGLAPTWYYALWSSGMLIPLVKKEPAAAVKKVSSAAGVNKESPAADVKKAAVVKKGRWRRSRTSGGAKVSPPEFRCSL